MWLNWIVAFDIAPFEVYGDVSLHRTLYPPLQRLYGKSTYVYTSLQTATKNEVEAVYRLMSSKEVVVIAQTPSAHL